MEGVAYSCDVEVLQTWIRSVRIFAHQVCYEASMQDPVDALGGQR